jgi:hypothetical protein
MDRTESVPVRETKYRIRDRVQQRIGANNAVNLETNGE